MIRASIGLLAVKSCLLSGIAAAVLVGGCVGSQVPTFGSEIAPILFGKCSVCHNPNGPAPFNLLTYDDAASRAQLIKRVTQRRYMPPWLPDSGYGHFAGERRLTQSQIDLIARWVDGGTPAGMVDEFRQPELNSGWQLGEPDLVVTAPRFDVAPHDSDIYRNLVVPIPIQETKYVRSVEFRPGGTNVVHHARMMVDSTDSSQLLDAEDAGPGFDGMRLVSNAQNPPGFFVGWTPGKVPYQSPPDMSWPIRPGVDLLLQVHLPASEETQVVAPQIGIYFARQPPKRKPALIMLGSFEINIPPGEANYVVTDTFTVPVDVSVLALYPHAHYLAKKIEGYADLPNGEREWLIRISDWDFNWQDEYHLAEPVHIPDGAKLTMRIVYDNSTANPRNPTKPPKRVVYGSNSTDEMADLVVQVLPKDADDLAFLQRNIDIWQYNNAVAQMARVERSEGLALAAEGRFAQAVEKFESSLAYVYDDAQTHNDIGSALAMAGDVELGAAHFREAAKLDPDWAEPAVNLAITLLALGAPEQVAEAVTSARRAADLTRKADPSVLDLLARALAASGEMPDAIRTAESALELAVAQARDDLAAAIRVRLAEWRNGGRAVRR